jgi:predicted MFS family arabinose efflux permease
MRFRGPDDLSLTRDGEPNQASQRASDKRSGNPSSDPPDRQLWSAAIGFALGLVVQIGFITHQIALARDALGVEGAGWLVSATGVAALAGRLVLARIVDQLDPRRLAMLVLGVESIVLLAMSQAASQPMVLVITCLLYGFGVGYVTTLGPIVVRREFGPVGFGRLYGKAAMLIQFTSACGPLLLGFLADRSHGYGPVLLLCAVLLALGCVALHWGRPRSRATIIER